METNSIMDDIKQISVDLRESVEIKEYNEKLKIVKEYLYNVCMTTLIEQKENLTDIHSQSLFNSFNHIIHNTLCAFDKKSFGKKLEYIFSFIVNNYLNLLVMQETAKSKENLTRMVTEGLITATHFVQSTSYEQGIDFDTIMGELKKKMME